MTFLCRHLQELLAAAGVLVGWRLFEFEFADHHSWLSTPDYLEIHEPLTDSYISMTTLFLCLRWPLAVGAMLLAADCVRTLQRLNGSLFRFHLLTGVVLMLSASTLFHFSVYVHGDEIRYGGWPFHTGFSSITAPLVLNGLSALYALLFAATLSETLLARLSRRPL